jgi:hypothetical protein
MCGKNHRYTIEVIGQAIRYSGTDEGEALSALLTINPDYDEEGYVVAEHADGETVTYCRAESNRMEGEAVKVRDRMETQWAAAREAFHGEGPYAIANQGF